MNYFTRLSLFLLPFCAVANPTLSKGDFVIHKFTYEDDIFSKESKASIGEKVEFELDTRYQFLKNSYLGLDFETVSTDNRFDSKTNRFEVLGSHTYKDLTFALDFELNTNESSNGGTTFGVDPDSDKSKISWQTSETLKLNFYPFNFDGEVGDRFNTWDVTRIHFFSGAPGTITQVQGSNQINTKTIPGLELNYDNLDNFKVYAGAGIASYEYPANSDFDILTNATATQWEKKNAFGYKFGFKLIEENVSAEFKYVGQNDSEKTGSLIDSAASFQYKLNISKIFIESELTYSKAGKRPYRLSSNGDWFEVTSQYEPIYADLFQQTQDWVGEKDFALHLKLALKLERLAPYVFYNYIGEHFIYDERDSAHRLRNADEDRSHGGLNVLGLGSYFYYGKFIVNPELEYKIAKNPVFTNATDLRGSRSLSTFEKTDFLLSLNLSYEFDFEDPLSL